MKKITKELEQPNPIDVGNVVIDKLKHDDYWSNPRNRKTRIIVEILMRECYYCGFNKAVEVISQITTTSALKGGERTMPIDFHDIILLLRDGKINTEEAIFRASQISSKGSDAVKFAKFVVKTGLARNDNGKWYVTARSPKDSIGNVTDEELYDLYLQSLTSKP